MLRIMLCDDDPSFLAELENILCRVLPDQPRTFLHFSTGADCVAAVCRGISPDVALLDIALPDMDGIAAASQIYQHDPSIPVIFITAFNNRYSQQIFLRDVNLCGYVTKPVDTAILSAQLVRALHRKGAGIFLPVTTPQGILHLPAAEICYIESHGHYLDVHTREHCYRYRAKLSEAESFLEADFFRPHSSYLVNMAQVCRLDGGEVALHSGARLPVSRSMARSARTKFLRYRGMDL